MKLPEEVDHSILVPDATTTTALSTVVFPLVSETLIVQMPPLLHGVPVTSGHVPGVSAIAGLTDRDNTNQTAKLPQRKR
jgi:hypothetical protein